MNKSFVCCSCLYYVGGIGGFQALEQKPRLQASYRNFIFIFSFNSVFFGMLSLHIFT